MSDRQWIPEWLLRTVIAAAFAVVGFVGKDLYEGWKDERAARTAHLGSLQELSALLGESKSIFESQNERANRLLTLLKHNHGEVVPDGVGYDEAFFQSFGRFNAEEVELQKLIRSTTTNSQRRLNEDMSKWLKVATLFKAKNQPNPQRVRLAEKLRTLELHLNDWRDKYEATIPNEPRRSLVYLADEKQHGTGFPPELDQAVTEVIASWQ